MKDEFLLNGKAPASEYFQNSGLRDLARAAAAGRTEEVTALIARGVDPNGQGKDTMTPLMWAVFAQNTAGVKALLDGGAHAQTPVIATRADGVSFRIYAIVYAARNCLPELMKTLLEHGADPETRNDGPYSLLMEAAECFPCFKLLIDHGANVNRGVDGAPEYTAVSRAATSLRYDAVLYALQHGYSVNLDELNYDIETGNASDDIKPLRAKILEILKCKNVKPWFPPYLRAASSTKP